MWPITVFLKFGIIDLPIKNMNLKISTTKKKSKKEERAYKKKLILEF